MNDYGVHNRLAAYEAVTRRLAIDSTINPAAEADYLLTGNRPEKAVSAAEPKRDKRYVVMTEHGPSALVETSDASVLDSLPFRAIVIDSDGDAWQKDCIDKWRCAGGVADIMWAHELVKLYGPVKILCVPPKEGQ